MDDSQLIRYDQMMEGALRGIIRQVLQTVEENDAQLPGQHHFYISFKTNHPDAVLPDFLREKYPEEMTVVMQHQFWDLMVHNDSFEVTLSFSKVPCSLKIPFIAITGFADPSVEFGLQFHSDLEAAIIDEEVENDAEADDDQKSSTSKKAKSQDNVVSLDSFRKD